ncbi:molybdopterin converting factor subunit 1 [Noviherbaspirillum autotrophicum]|uniref:Molybdenum cofactor biosynthesis protein MoaD n=1 Tax=Noviherbaspirillum autotrophicum TaxID=709839 RepID=A0A0C1Y0Z9_9BURK|nr:molybdopterin converting factor subunit 1 [Noviherbaspirillum autotrophicum]KIF80733.1 molybdenum cofactor biosynthesis protein MoaD [Noviherbaspirillum autotrophicum]
MNIQLRFFASIREALGTSQEAVALPAHVQTVGDVRAFLRERGGMWAEALAEGRALRMAYNQQMTEAGTRVAEGGEVAFFPPVTGG